MSDNTGFNYLMSSSTSLGAALTALTALTSLGAALTTLTALAALAALALSTSTIVPLIRPVAIRPVAGGGVAMWLSCPCGLSQQTVYPNVSQCQTTLNGIKAITKGLPLSCC